MNPNEIVQLINTDAFNQARRSSAQNLYCTNIAGKLNQLDIGEGNFNYHMMKVFHDFLIRQLYENFEKYLPRGVFL